LSGNNKHNPALKRELRELRLQMWLEFPGHTVWGEHHRPDECGECPLDDRDDDVAMIPE
jgi:hypothetical protein